METVSMVVGVVIVALLSIDTSNWRNVVAGSIRLICGTALILVPIILKYKTL